MIDHTMSILTSSSAHETRCLSEEHRTLLRDSAVDPELAERDGAYTAHTVDDLPSGLKTSPLPALVFAHHRPDGHVIYQARPDNPEAENKRYQQEPGTPPLISVPCNRRGLIGSASHVLIVEGTKQTLAAATHAPDDWLVVGLSGCWGWSVDQQADAAIDEVVQNARTITLAFDADWSINTGVWDACNRLSEHLRAVTGGAAKLRFVRLPAGRKTGLDDWLAPRTNRRTALVGLVEQATEKMGRRPAPKARTRTVSSADSIINETPAIPNPEICVLTADLPLTEDGLARRWLAHHGATWHKRREDGAWFHWTGKVWQKATPDELLSTVRATVLAVGAYEVQHRLSATEDSASELRYQAEAWQNPSVYARVAGMLGALDGVTIEERQWDAEPLLINTPAGVIDLDTPPGQSPALLPHDPGLLLTRITADGTGEPTEPTADLLTLLEGFARTDPAIPAFLQTVSGVCVTGLSPGFFSHIWGVGGTGKSALLQALMAAMGTYAVTIVAKTLEVQRGGGGENATSGLNRLRGVRAAYLDEASRIRLNWDLVKGLTSGGKVTSRALRHDEEEWRSLLTLIFGGNGPFPLDDLDTGVIRRFFPIEIGAASVPAVVDAGLVERMLADPQNAAAVLAWAVRGAKAWLDRGGSVAAMNAPEGVLQAQRRYLATSDPLAAWIDAEVDILDEPCTSNVTVATLHEHYVAWCRRHSQINRSLNAFTQRLEIKYGLTEKVSRGSRADRVQGRFCDRLALRSVTAEGMNSWAVR